MIRRLNGRHVWLPVAACLTVLAFALPQPRRPASSKAR